MEGYPAPRYPKHRKIESVEELMPKAIALVNQPPGQPPTSMKPSYGIERGNKILFVILSEWHPLVIEAMCRAIREKGAYVDLHVIDSSPLTDPESLAAHEAIALDKDEGDYNYYYTMITNLVRTSTAVALKELNHYDMVISGLAGPLPPVSFPWYRFNYISLEDFASPQIDFPFELQKLIDDKVFEALQACEKLRLTDPEGTDISWTNYKDDRPYMMNHQFARPVNIGLGFGGKDDCSGVVAGTANHLGAFPQATAHLKNGQVIKVEGGGKYGDVWREKLEKYRNVILPPMPKYDPYGSNPFSPPAIVKMPEPGFFWFRECAIGTSPGAFRLPQEARFECYANFLHDRRRSGYVHNGFGPSTTAAPIMIKAGLPWSHLHIHTLFPTLQGVASDGRTVKVIDKGHLTGLEDPEVRKHAAKYGNPDELLREAWFPAIPGINAPGDYMKDYASNPIPWISKEGQEHPYWL